MKVILLYLIFAITPQETLLISGTQWIGAQPRRSAAAPNSPGAHPKQFFDSDADCKKELARQAKAPWLAPAPNQFRVGVCVAVPHSTP